MSRTTDRSDFSPGRQPFLYLAAALLAGILVDRWVQPSGAPVVLVAIAFFVASLKLILARKDSAATVVIVISFAFA